MLFSYNLNYSIILIFKFFEIKFDNQLFIKIENNIDIDNYYQLNYKIEGEFQKIYKGGILCKG